MDRDGVLRLDGVYLRGFGIVPKFVMHDDALSLESKAIYSYFCSLAGNGSITFPYRDTILRHLKLSKNTYYRHYKPLIEEGYIVVSRSVDKKSPNIYTLVSNPKKFTHSTGEPELEYSSRRPYNSYEVKDVCASSTHHKSDRLGYRGMKSRGYGIIPRAVMMDDGISVKAKGLYAYLCSYCGAGDCAFPKRDNIVFHLGVSEPTYYKCYNELIKSGYLVVSQSMNGTKFGGNNYYLSDRASSDGLERCIGADSLTGSCPDKPHLKNCDMINTHNMAQVIDNETMSSESEGTVPYPKFRDIKTGYTKNRDTIIYNSNNKNRKYTINQSIKADDTIDNTEIRQLNKILAGVTELKAMRKVDADKICEEFLTYFRDRPLRRDIRSFSAYLEKSFLNWLHDRNLKRTVMGEGLTRAVVYPQNSTSTLCKHDNVPDVNIKVTKSAPMNYGLAFTRTQFCYDRPGYDLGEFERFINCGALI